MTFYEGMPGMDSRVGTPGAYRTMADRAVAYACGSRLARHQEGLYRQRQDARNYADHLFRHFLQPNPRMIGSDEDGYFRRLNLCLATDQCAPGTDVKEVVKLAVEGYSFMAGARVLGRLAS